MAKVTKIIAKMKSFVDQVYVPDTVLIAGFYKSQSGYVGWETRGGTGWNYLCYGEFPETGIRNKDDFLIPQGVLEAGSLMIKPLDMENHGEIQEYVTRSWYKYLGVGNSVGLHPSEGQTNLDYAGRGGPAPGPKYTLNKASNAGYSWIKSPRWYNKPMEVGPLAHVVMMYAKAKASPKTDAEIAHKRAKDLVDSI